MTRVTHVQHDNTIGLAITTGSSSDGIACLPGGHEAADVLLRHSLSAAKVFL